MWRTSRRASSPRWARRQALNEDFNISASRELTVAEIARIVWEACGEDPEAFELEHLPTFAVDVQRRWPSVEKAQRLLGWRARIDVEDGIAATVRWLRSAATVRAAHRCAAHRWRSHRLPPPCPNAPQR